MIRIENAEIVFPQNQVGIGPITAEVPSGQWVTLLGASGSGKTTLLRMLAGLQSTTAGTMTQPHRSKDMGYVFQEHALLPWKNALDNILMPLSLRGESPETMD